METIKNMKEFVNVLKEMRTVYQIEIGIFDWKIRYRDSSKNTPEGLAILQKDFLDKIINKHGNKILCYIKNGWIILKRL